MAEFHKIVGFSLSLSLKRSLQEVQLDKHIKLLDSPGVVMAYEGADIATLILRNCIKVETLDDPVSPVEAILRRCNRLQVLLATMPILV